MAFEEFQSFQTKPRRSSAGLIAVLLTVGLGIGVSAYWYTHPAGLKSAATAEITPDAASPAEADTPSPNAKPSKASASVSAPGKTPAAVEAVAPVHSGKAGRSTPAAAKTSSETAATSHSGGAQAVEGEPIPAYAPAAGSTVQLARAPADPRQYDRSNAEVIAPVLLTPLSHVPLPPEIRREASSTDVAISVMVNEEGTVDIVKATVSPRTLGESILVYNGLSIAKTWRFRPASKDGLPVKYRLLVPLSMF